MARRATVCPDTSDGWVDISDRELANVGASLRGKASHDAVIDHALRATETILKSLIWKRNGWSEWPRNSGKNRYLYRHDLKHMLQETGFEDPLLANPERAASWQTLINANEKQHRYSQHIASDKVAWAVAKAARDLDKGVIPWLKRHYEKLT